MSSIRNSVQLIGNVGKDIELKTIANGSSVANFSLATNEYYKNTKGEKVQETQWHNIVIWGKLAERAHKVLSKGAEVLVTGKITYRSYETADGSKRYVTEIKADDFVAISKKNEDDNDNVPF